MSWRNITLLCVDGTHDTKKWSIWLVCKLLNSRAVKSYGNWKSFRWLNIMGKYLKTNLLIKSLFCLHIIHLQIYSVSQYLYQKKNMGLGFSVYHMAKVTRSWFSACPCRPQALVQSWQWVGMQPYWYKEKKQTYKQKCDNKQFTATSFTYILFFLFSTYNFRLNTFLHNTCNVISVATK